MPARARTAAPPATAKGPVPRRILSAARARFERYGYRRTGVADIARDVGVAAGTLYRYFENKEDLFVRVFELGIEEWIETAREVLSEPGTAVERLERLGAASVVRTRKHGLLNSVLERDTEIIFAPLLDELHERLLEENVAMMADVIRGGIERGELAPVDPERAAYVLFLSGDALVRHGDTRPYAEVLPVLRDITMNGLLPRDSSLARGEPR